MLQALTQLIYLLKKDFTALRPEFDKLDFNEINNVPKSLNNLKAKVTDLDVGKLKTVPVDLKNLIDVLDEELVNTKFNTLETKVNSLEKKILDATTLFHANQYNTDRQNLEKPIGDANKENTRYNWFSE